MYCCLIMIWWQHLIFREYTGSLVMETAYKVLRVLSLLPNKWDCSHLHQASFSEFFILHSVLLSPLSMKKRCHACSLSSDASISNVVSVPCQSNTASNTDVFFLGFSADEVWVSVDGALFFVFSVTAAITAHASSFMDSKQTGNVRHITRCSAVDFPQERAAWQSV